MRAQSSAPQLPTGATLSRAAETFLADRAEFLLARVRARSPAVDHVLAVAAGLTWLGRVVLGVAMLFGAESVGPGRKPSDQHSELPAHRAGRVESVRVCGADRGAHPAPPDRRSRSGAGGFWSGRVYERWIGRRVDSLLHQSTRFNAPLATALRRFTSEWAAVVHPLLLERAKLLMHLAAAFVAVGLILGLYLRGLVFRYEAGWESTFLSASAVHALAVLFYGPAAALSGIGVPAADALAALRWTGSSGGAEAASWIHLIALTAALYIVAPRVILAILSRYKLWRLSRRAPLPASLLGHARTLLGRRLRRRRAGKRQRHPVRLRAESAVVHRLADAVGWRARRRGQRCQHGHAGVLRRGRRVSPPAGQGAPRIEAGSFCS